MIYEQEVLGDGLVAYWSFEDDESVTGNVPAVNLSVGAPDEARRVADLTARIGRDRTTVGGAFRSGDWASVDGGHDLAACVGYRVAVDDRE